MCKADVRKCLEDELAMRLPLSEPREIYKNKLETDNRSNIGSEFNFVIDLPGKRDRSTIYRLNLIKLYRRKPELANLVMENSSEGIDSATLYSVKLFMDFGFQCNLRKSQLYFKLPPDRSSYLRMINAKKKERFLPESGTIVLRQKDVNLVTGKPFRIKTCCSSQMSINSLREDTEYLLDLGVNGMGQSNRTLPVVWFYGFTSWSRTGSTSSIVPAFLRSTSCGMTSARGHGAIVYCLNSGSEERQTGRPNSKEQVCPDVDKELWRLGPDGSGVFWRVMRKSVEGGQERLCDLPMRRNEGRVVNTPWCLKGFFFREKGKKVGRGGRGDRRENGRNVGREKGEVGRGGRVESGRENGRKEKRERTEGVRDWTEKDDERRWR
ncbi:uncharacterized protein TNCV_2493351 [Trichonephila clavipes]|uniref:Uncharacterized protein n=1 Tax=Trichonephila clavipes TaxID=2585209 RepID=A0A8X6RUR8_TRICX|nr:uncharacterized protein TNCV_2493351 [Trichonephila clavipes]